MTRPTDDWTQVEPRKLPLRLALGSGHRGLTIADTDGAVVDSNPSISGMNCPLAVSKQGFLYAATRRPEGPGTAIVRCGVTAPSNADVVCEAEDLSYNWLLSISGDETELVAFSKRVTGDYSSAPSLTFLGLGSHEVHTVPMPEDVFFPYAVAHDLQMVLFDRRGMPQHRPRAALVSFSGDVVAEISLPQLHSAVYCPSTQDFLVSAGTATYTVRHDVTEPRMLFNHGIFASDIPGRRIVAYRTGHADLWCYDLSDGKRTAIQRLDSLDSESNDWFRRFGYASRPIPSPDGNYIAATMTSSRPTTEDEREDLARFKRARGKPANHLPIDYTHEHRICVADLASKVYWNFAGSCYHIAWI